MTNRNVPEQSTTPSLSLLHHLARRRRQWPPPRLRSHRMELSSSSIMNKKIDAWEDGQMRIGRRLLSTSLWPPHGFPTSIAKMIHRVTR